MNLHHLSLYFSGLGGVEFMLCGTNNLVINRIMGTIMLLYYLYSEDVGT